MSRCKLCKKAENSTEEHRAKRREQAKKRRALRPPSQKPFITDEQITESYARTSNVWKTGEELGMLGQTVHSRLMKLGLNHKVRILTDEEKRLIEEVYHSGILLGDGKLQALSQQIHRHISTICTYAKSVGLTISHRPPTEEGKKAISQRNKEWIAQNGHPHGMLGKHHSEETKKQVSQAAKNLWADPNSTFNTEAHRAVLRRNSTLGTLKRLQMTPESIYSRSVRGWHEFPGEKRYFLRSKWEINYAHFLEWQKVQGCIQEWWYEPDIFHFEQITQGVHSYLPDFKVLENSGEIKYVEIKGWMDEESKAKLRYMTLYYPHIKLELVGEKEYYALYKRAEKEVPGWE